MFTLLNKATLHSNKKTTDSHLIFFSSPLHNIINFLSTSENPFIINLHSNINFSSVLTVHYPNIQYMYIRCFQLLSHPSNKRQFYYTPRCILSCYFPNIASVRWPIPSLRVPRKLIHATHPGA